MGYGSQMKIVNNRTTDIHTFVTDVNCMYDQGHEGSELSLFDDAKIPAKHSLPDDAGSNGQYIEAKGSGGCVFETSTFTVKIEDASNNAVLGRVDFADNDHNWEYSNTNPSVVDVYINNSGGEGIIRITVEGT